MAGKGDDFDVPELYEGTLGKEAPAKAVTDPELLTELQELFSSDDEKE